MKIHVYQVDVTQQLAEKQPVTSAVWRSGDKATPGSWRILQQPVGSRLTEDSWTTDADGAQIRVPMFTYRLNSPELGTLTTFGLQLAAAVMGTLLPAGKLEELLMLHSTVYQRDDAVPGYQLWVGVAAKLS
jgi:hypothetical protein